jgi:predicted nucleotidyltransferase
MLTKQANPTESLFGRAREAVIGILFGEPGARYHVREIARQAGLSAPTIAHELAQLRRAGVLKAEAVGNQLQFMANDQYPLAPELRSIAVKTWGVIGRLRAALSTRKDIEVAFVFGSYARGAAGIASDIDLIVMSEASIGDYTKVAAALSDELRRTVSLKLYRKAEWRRKLAASNPFVMRVIEEPKIFLVGGEEDLHGRKAPRGDARKGLDSGALAVKGRNRRAPSGSA